MTIDTVIVQGNQQLFQSHLRIPDKGQGIMFVGVEFSHIDVDKSYVAVLEGSFTGGCEIAVARANADDQIRLFS